MHYFYRVLKKQKFVAGEVFSMADITVIGGFASRMAAQSAGIVN
jgi:glutathione S-transferase